MTSGSASGRRGVRVGAELCDLGGNVAAAARELRLTVRILHYTIRKLGVVPQEFR